MSAPNNQNRRQVERLNLELMISYEHRNIKFSDFTFDLSEGGIFIETRTPLESRTRLTLSIKLPTEAAAIDILGEVMWRRPISECSKGEVPGMGLRFVELDDLTKTKLDRAIKQIKQVKNQSA